MNTEVLKTFCDLVDTGSFSKAAGVNYISQSAVSQQLARLERELATQLVTRGGGIVTPTEAGKAFYRGAKDILRRYEQVLGEVRSAADSIRGVLRVGTIYSVGFYLLDPYVREFLKAHPEVNLHVEYTASSRIYTAVINDQMDLGVVAYPQRQRLVEIIPLVGEELVVVCPPTHRLARRKTIDAAELNGEKFVAFDKSIPTRRNIDRLLKGERVKVNIVMEFDNIELLKRAIYVESGLSILPLDNVVREVRLGDLGFCRLRNAAKWVRSVAVIRRRGKTPSPAERMLLGILRAELAKAKRGSSRRKTR
ncbi:MAG: LysR family transcriptional regulator [Planctomycetota bacterium]|nr:LysR family transcriptional regulator [Planctomycetota bacterium]